MENESSSSSGSGRNKRARVEAKESLANGQGKKTLTFSSSFGGHDVRLIEISEDMAKCIERGETLSIIGSTDTTKGGTTDAVLCSQNTTYTIKKVETSNSVLIVPPSDENTYQIHSLSQYYYELKPTPARTERIVELLRRTEYLGAIADTENPVDTKWLLSYDELRQEIQASDEEFTSSLFTLCVVELRGKMRMLSIAAVREVTRDLLDTIMEQGWSIEAINEQACLNAMSGTDPVLLNFALKTIGHPTTVNGDIVWTLAYDAVCKATAHILFNTQSPPSKPWDREEFLSTWESRTPGNQPPDENLLLNGIALKIENKNKSIGTSKNNNETISPVYLYVYMPVEMMKSMDAQTRLTQLFSIQTKFLFHDLEPYFRDLIGSVGQPKSVTELLLQCNNCRMLDGYYIPK